MDWRKRLLALLMSFAMVLTYMPTIAFAEGGAAEAGDTPAVEEVQDVQAQNDGAAQEVSSESSEQTGEAAQAEQPAIDQKDTARNSNEAAVLEQEEVVPEEEQPEEAVKKQTSPQSTKSVTDDVSWGLAETQREYYPKRTDLTVDLDVEIGLVYSEQERYFVVDWYAYYPYHGEEHESLLKAGDPSDPYVVAGTGTYDFTYTAPLFSDLDDPVYGVNSYTGYRCAIRQVDENGQFMNADELEMYLHWDVDNREIEWISYELANGPVELVENVDGYMVEAEDGSEYFYYYFDEFLHEGDQLTIKYADEDEPWTYTYHYDEEEPAFRRQVGDEWDYIYLSEGLGCGSTQTGPWEVGEHSFTFRYMGATTDYPVVIVKSNVKAIRFARAGYDENHPIELTEGVDGTYDNVDFAPRPFFHYWMDTKWDDGDELTVTREIDGELVDTVYHMDGEFINDNDSEDYIKTNDISEKSNQDYEHQWIPGNEEPYVIQLSYMGATCPVYFKVVPNDVESISFSRPEYEGQPIPVVRWPAGEEYYYQFIYSEGDTLQVKYAGYADPFTYVYSDDENEGVCFVLQGDAPAEVRRTLDQNDVVTCWNDIEGQPDSQMWELGGTYNLELSCMCRTCQVPIVIVSDEPEGPHWEIDGDEERTVYYYEGDEEVTLDIDINYYNYEDEDYPELTYIWYREGEEEPMSSESSISVPAAQETYLCYVRDEEYNTQAVTFYVRPSGGIDDEEPVYAIEFSRGNGMDHYELYENDGMVELGDEVDGEPVSYWGYEKPEFEDGDTLTVYADENDTEGTVYTYSSTYYVFVTKDDEQLNMERLSESSNQSYNNQWEFGGTGYEFIIGYYDAEVSVPVTIIRSEYDSIDFVRSDGTTAFDLVENKDGDIAENSYFDEETQEQVVHEFFHYDPYFDEGDRLILKKDGEDDIVYEYRYSNEDDDTWYFVNVNDDEDRIDRDDVRIQDGQSYENQWSVGNTYEGSVVYQGLAAPVTFNILENPIAGIELVRVDGISYNIPQNCLGYIFYPEGDDSGYYYYMHPKFKEGDQLKITYKGTELLTKTYTYHPFTESGEGGGWYGAFVSVIDPEDVIPETELYYSDDQDDTHWELGGEGYKFTLYYEGATYDVPVNIIPNPVTEIRFSRPGVDTITLIQGIDSYEDECELNDDNYVKYDYYNFNFEPGDIITAVEGNEEVNYVLDGDKFIFIREDDPTEWFSPNDYAEIFDDQGPQYDEDDNEYVNEWQPGETHNFTLSFMDHSVDIPVNIEANPITGMRFVRPGFEDDPIELVADKDIRLNDDGDYYIDFEFKDGDELYISVDGYDEPVKYVAKAYDSGYVYELQAEGEVPDVLQETYEPWDFYTDYTDVAYEAGETGTFKLELSGASANIDYVVVGNPVASIQFVRDGVDGTFNLEEGVDGFWSYFEDGHKEFDYRVRYHAGDKFIVEYTDLDEPVTYTYRMYEDRFAVDNAPENVPNSIPEYYVDQNSDQNDGQVWDPEDDPDHVITFWYSGREYPVDVHLVPTEVDSISFSSVDNFTEDNPAELVENVDGWEDEGAGVFRYNFSFGEGDVLTIHYKNGSTANYVYRLWRGFINEETGEHLDEENLNVDGNIFYDEEWHPEDGLHYITILYRGRETTVPVVVVENNLDSLEFVSGGAHEVVYENEDFGYFDEDLGYFVYYNPSFVAGDTIILNYNDGTSEEYTFDPEIEWFAGETGKALRKDVHLGGDQDSALEIGPHDWPITIMGKTAYIPYKIVPPAEVVHVPAKESTCQVRGNIEYWTKDGKYYADEECTQELTEDEVFKPLAAHTPGTAVHENEAVATCEHEGHYDEVVYCTVCGEEISRTPVTTPKTAHTPGTAVRQNEVAATCEHEGHYDEVVLCTVCGEELSRNTVTVPKTAHTPGEPVHENEVAATCAAGGSYDEVIYCTACGTEISRTAKTTPKSDVHTPGTAVRENEVPASCTKEGSYDEVVYCSVCNTELSRTKKTIAKVAHTPAAAVRENEVPASCTKEGSYDEVVYCSVCHNEISRTKKTIAKTAHTPVVVPGTPATCDTAGLSDGKKCSVCNAVIEAQTEIPALGHDYGTPVYTWNDDLTECTAMVVCQRNVQHSIVKAGIVTETITKEPTQSEKGSKTVTATFTDEHFQTQTKVVEIPSLHTHTPGTPVYENVTKKATTSATGVADKVTYCTECGEEISREAGAEIPKAVAPATTTIRNTVANSSKKTNDVIWDKVAGATNYELRWRARGGSWKSTTVGNVVRGVTTGLTIGGLYEIQVRPFKAATATTEKAYGNWSGIVYRYFFTTQKIRLTSKSKGTFTMSWAKDSKATGYQVLFTTNSNGSGAAKNIVNVKASATSVTVSKFLDGKGKFKSGQTIYVQVRELRKVGNITYVGNISCPVAVKIK